MGFFSDLFGGSKRDDIDEGLRTGSAALSKNYQLGRDQITAGRDRAMTFLKPQIDAGTTASDSYMAGLGLKGAEAQTTFYDNFQHDPGYQASLDAGLKAVNTTAAAKGYMLSGRALKELQDYGQQAQTAEFDKRMGRLSELSGRGSQVAQGAATMEFNAGNQMAQAYAGEGGALANMDFQAGAAKANTRFSLGDLAQIIGAGARGYAAFK